MIRAMVLVSRNNSGRDLSRKVAPGVIAVLSGLLLLAGAAAASAQSSVTLAWDPSPSAEVKGYKIYYGGASGAYTNAVTVGNTTNATVAGLKSGTIYYFAATAFDSLGIESEMSNEIDYVVQGPFARIRMGVSAQKRPVLSGTAPAGYRYDVQASQDLKTWSTVGSVIVDSAGAFQYTDSSPTTNYPERMYRLRQSSP